MAERDLDVVLYGATGFVGRLTADYLARAAPADARIALGGRSEAKLNALRESLGVDWEVVVAGPRTSLVERPGGAEPALRHDVVVRARRTARG